MEKGGANRTGFWSMLERSVSWRSSISTLLTRGGSWSSYIGLSSRLSTLTTGLSRCWRSCTGTIRRRLGLRSTRSPTRPYEYLRQIRSQSTSSTPSEPEESLKMSFPYQDIMAAKVMVKRLVGAGVRKGPNDLLVIPNAVAEQWYTDEAVRYLQEQKEKRSQPVAVIH